LFGFYAALVSCFPAQQVQCDAAQHREVLGSVVFVSVAEAKARVEAHRHWYNEERPHSSLKYLPPKRFAEVWQQRQTLQNQEALEPPE